MDKDTPASLEKDQKNEQKPQESAAPEYKKDERILYRLMPALTFASLEKTWMATQETEEAPNDKLDYEVGELVCTCLPAKLISVTRATNLDGWTECLLTGLVKRTILETPSFPQSLSQPKKSLHYIADAPAAGEATSKPLTGLHASTSIEMGDLVFSERPVLIVPASIRIGEIFVEHLSHEEQNRLVMKHWLETLETVFHRVSKKDQEAFWKLRDIWQKDGKKSIHGIVQTNGFKVTGLEDPGLEGNLGMYSGVCIQMSQINHSCRPNLERYWDMASFSMQLRATRKISRGEELTLSFIDQLQPFAVRKEKLKQFDIVCSCPSCKKPKIGDMRRKQFIAGSPSTQEFTDWIKDPTRGDDHIIKRALVQISLLEADGLENSPYYDDCLSTIMLVYITLGDKDKAMRWGKQLGKWKQCRLGPESAREYDNPQKYTKHALWKLRVKIVNDMRATSYSLGKH
ncbi:hypothetical protein BDP27DRAFT_59429 [Rhodocollybia butyracea]|uniref:SET domain-containing protein n=1 Tax=Rhodocollybia butyracea TaxID=206335 RepID=A0A9P5U3Z4_9AGAR|nr:hypothetical protein BDP27DRAFT_59429 [Rhodocollybia butyracea]